MWYQSYDSHIKHNVSSNKWHKLTDILIVDTFIYAISLTYLFEEIVITFVLEYVTLFLRELEIPASYNQQIESIYTNENGCNHFYYHVTSVLLKMVKERHTKHSR